MDKIFLLDDPEESDLSCGSAKGTSVGRIPSDAVPRIMIGTSCNFFFALPEFSYSKIGAALVVDRSSASGQLSPRAPSLSLAI